MSDPTVRLPGILLASLMFQHANSDSDVEGLLLGESRSDEQVTISDSQADRVHILETFNVQKHVACHRPHSLCNSSGEVERATLEEMLEESGQGAVVGWYRQRRHSEQLMSFGEKLAHEQLRRALGKPRLLFLLLTTSGAAPSGSTHSTEFSAFICSDGCFSRVPVLLSNLGLLEQPGYWNAPAPCSALGYSATMRTHGSKFFGADGLRDVSAVKEMNEALQNQLRVTCSAVVDSELHLEALQSEVSALRSRLAASRPGAAGESEGGAGAEPRVNSALVAALQALLGRAPSQTLSLRGRPVPERPPLARKRRRKRRRSCSPEAFGDAGTFHAHLPSQ